MGINFKSTKMLKLFTFIRNVRFKNAIQWQYRQPSEQVTCHSSATQGKEEYLTNSIILTNLIIIILINYKIKLIYELNSWFLFLVSASQKYRKSILSCICILYYLTVVEYIFPTRPVFSSRGKNFHQRGIVFPEGNFLSRAKRG